MSTRRAFEAIQTLISDDEGTLCARCEQQGAAGRNRDVVVAGRRVADVVLAVAACAPLQGDEFGLQAGVVEQFDLAAVEERQALAEDVGGGQAVRQFVADASLAKRLASELAGIAVARHFADAVGLQQVAELTHDRLGRERRLADPNSVEDSPAVLLGVSDALAPYALFSIQQRVIGTIAIDVPIREVHDHSFVITQNPTQAGYAAADGYFASPCRVEMTCGFSDSTAGYEGYVQQVFAAFLALAEANQPFSVSTGKNLYNNMMVENISVRTDPTSEYVLDITVRLQEFIITDTDVQSSTSSMTSANQANPSETSPTVDGGKVTLQPATSPGLTPSGFVAGPN